MFVLSRQQRATAKVVGVFQHPKDVPFKGKNNGLKITLTEHECIFYKLSDVHFVRGGISCCVCVCVLVCVLTQLLWSTAAGKGWEKFAFPKDGHLFDHTGTHATTIAAAMEKGDNMFLWSMYIASK
jgi:hypothetical protein